MLSGGKVPGDDVGAVGGTTGDGADEKQDELDCQLATITMLKPHASHILRADRLRVKISRAMAVVLENSFAVPKFLDYTLAQHDAEARASMSGDSPRITGASSSSGAGVGPGGRGTIPPEEKEILHERSNNKQTETNDQANDPPQTSIEEEELNFLVKETNCDLLIDVCRLDCVKPDESTNQSLFHIYGSGPSLDGKLDRLGYDTLIDSLKLCFTTFSYSSVVAGRGEKAFVPISFLQGDSFVERHLYTKPSLVFSLDFSRVTIQIHDLFKIRPMWFTAEKLTPLLQVGVFLEGGGFFAKMQRSRGRGAVVVPAVAA